MKPRALSHLSPDRALLSAAVGFRGSVGWVGVRRLVGAFSVNQRGFPASCCGGCGVYSGADPCCRALVVFLKFFVEHAWPCGLVWCGLVLPGVALNYVDRWIRIGASAIA